MILHRPKTDLGGAPPAHPGKRVMRLRLVLLLIAGPLTLVLALALTATLLPRGFSHAADKLPVEWVPGDIQNIQDLSGCHARQDATIKTSTPELAGTIRDQVNLVQEKNLGENGLKLAYIWKADASGNSVVLEIETWYTGECPGPSASTRQPVLQLMISRWSMCWASERANGKVDLRPRSGVGSLVGYVG
jgi:hypothetical protein